MPAGEPRTRYAAGGEFHVAYQTLGSGPPDVMFVPWFHTHIEVQWEEPLVARFLRRLSSFGRLIVFDKRGAGLSDPVPLTSPPSLEEWMDDVRVVMDAAASERAALVAHSGGGLMAMLFAATFPERVSHLVLLEAYPRLLRGPDYACGVSPKWFDAYEQIIETAWGTGRSLQHAVPSLSGDGSLLEWLGRYERMAASPGAARAMARLCASVDLRSVLPAIQTPTLVLHRNQNGVVPVDHGRYLAAHIPTARLVEIPGSDHAFFAGDTRRVLDEIERFVTGTTQDADPERTLATVLFTDIVDSTRRAAAMGDAQWGDLLDRHDTTSERLIGRFRGKITKRTGDGLVATFDGPARAIRCGVALRDAMRALGLQLRLGLHAGEVLVRGTDIAGLGVHVAARVQALAVPDEVLVSSTVRDLVAGSGFVFADRGRQALKGIPEPWQVYAVEG